MRCATPPARTGGLGSALCGGSGIEPTVGRTTTVFKTVEVGPLGRPQGRNSAGQKGCRHVAAGNGGTLPPLRTPDQRATGCCGVRQNDHAPWSRGEGPHCGVPGCGLRSPFAGVSAGRTEDPSARPWIARPVSSRGGNRAPSPLRCQRRGGMLTTSLWSTSPAGDRRFSSGRRGAMGQPSPSYCAPSTGLDAAADRRGRSIRGERSG